MDLAREPTIDDRHPVRGSSTPKNGGFSSGGFLFPHRFAFEFDLVAVVDNAIKDRIGKGWFGQELVPFAYR